MHSNYHCWFAELSFFVCDLEKYSHRFRYKNISIFDTFLWSIREFKRRIGSTHLLSKSQQIRSNKQLIFANKWNKIGIDLPEISFFIDVY